MDFDNVYIHPIAGEVESRTEVDLGTKFKSLELGIPVIASPMRGITGTELIIKLAELGGIGILHRFYKTDSAWKTDVAELSEGIKYNQFGLSVGLDRMDRVEYALSYEPKILCIDVANGYLSSVKRFGGEVANFIQQKNCNTLLMTGNVVCWNGVKALADVGVDMIRVGIGSGALCTTRLQTGIGKPQLQAIQDCNMSLNPHMFASNLGVALVADGGITSSGDIVKALVAGADFVMMGSWFANAYESDNNGVISGMASQDIQEEYYHNVRGVEGRSRTAKKTISLEELINQWRWGISSACTYVNARNIDQLKKNAKFIKAM